MKSTKRIKREQVTQGFDLTTALASVDWNAFRREWLEAARETSVGVSLFNFGPKTWDYPQTLGSILDANPKIKRRFDRWVNAKNPTFPNCLIGERLAYMLRK